MTPKQQYSIDYLSLAHPISDPHPQGVGHANETKEEEDPNTFKKVRVEGKVKRWGEENCSDELSFGGHEPCPNNDRLHITSCRGFSLHDLEIVVILL